MNFFPHLGQRNLCDKQLATNAPMLHPMKTACRANEIAWRFQESARVFRNESSTPSQTMASKAQMKNRQNIRRGARYLRYASRISSREIIMHRVVPGK